jgi:hypothetical protein
MRTQCLVVQLQCKALYAPRIRELRSSRKPVFSFADRYALGPGLSAVLQVNREITERFGEVLEQARRGELDYSQQTITKLLTSYTYPSSGCRGGTSR